MFSSSSPSAHPSRLGLGTGTLGSLGRSASAREVSAILDAMQEYGISVIDTADAYGSGHTERLLGNALRGRREQFFLMTKAGYRHGSLPAPFHFANPFIKKFLHRTGRRQCFEPRYLERCLEGSLRRLGTDRVDVYYLHDPTKGDLDPALQALVEMKARGRIGAIGVSSGETDVIDQVLLDDRVTFLQCPANLIAAGAFCDRWATAASQGLIIVANHVMGRAISGMPGLTREVMMRAAAALLPYNAVILCGTRNPAHLLQANGWANEPLPTATALNLLEQVSRIHR